MNIAKQNHENNNIVYIQNEKKKKKIDPRISFLNIFRSVKSLDGLYLLRKKINKNNYITQNSEKIH